MLGHWTEQPKIIDKITLGLMRKGKYDYSDDEGFW